MNFEAVQGLNKTGIPLSMPMPSMSVFDEVSTGDDSEGGSYPLVYGTDLGTDATRRSSSTLSYSTDDFRDASPDSAPPPWTVPFPGEFVPAKMELHNDILRAMEDMQSTPNLQDPHGFFQRKQAMAQNLNDAGYVSNDMAQKWLQKEVAELANLMAQRESEMQTLHQQLALLSMVQAPLPKSDVNQGLETQIHLLRSQLDQITDMMRRTQLGATGASPQGPRGNAAAAKDDILTVMMRNIPNKYTQKMLIDEVNEVGFNGTWDFLYLPIDRESGANKGYAFINFLRPDYAYAFKRAFNGKQMALFKSNKIVNVTPAAIQGFEANFEHFSRTRVNFGDPDARPLFLRKVQKVQKLPQRASGQLRSQPTPGEDISSQFVFPGSCPPSDWSPEAGTGFCTFCGARRSPVHQFCQGCGRTSSALQ